MIGFSAFLGFWLVLHVWGGSETVARSTAFAIAAFSQLAFSLVCRSQRYTLPELGLFSNGWLFLAFACSGLLQLGMMFAEPTRGIFKLAPWQEIPWLSVMLLSLLPATVIEVTKIIWKGLKG
ncbi:MAG: cation-translocating P-type ATPase C-terminal domain-containing protein [Pirellulaceae bacterium]